MSDLTIKTNNVPRPIIYGFELTAKEAAEFDYLEGDALSEASFFRYRGRLYDIGEFMATSEDPRQACSPFGKWDGYHSDSYFSGIVMRYPSHDWDHVIVGTYYA